MNEPNETMLRRWLLHQLPEHEAAPLEERLLQDDAFGITLRAIETDLLDDYARNELTAVDRAAVARHLLATPRDRERLRIATALVRHTASTSTTAPARTPHRRVAHPPDTHQSSRHRRHTALWAGLASACVVLVAVVGVTALHHRNASAPHGSATLATVTIALAEPERGASITDVRIPHGAGQIRLQAEVATASLQARYTLAITHGDQTVFRAANLAPREAAPYTYVEAVIGAQVLKDGVYRVSVVPADGKLATVWSIRTRTGAAPAPHR